MQIEEGRFYRTRDGRKAGPANPTRSHLYPWALDVDGARMSCTEDGAWSFEDGDHPLDLIAEWTDEPDETTAAIRGVMAASEPPRPVFAELQPDGTIKPLSILGALEPLLAIGTVPALLAAGDVIRREIARLEEGAK